MNLQTHILFCDTMTSITIDNFPLSIDIVKANTIPKSLKQNGLYFLVNEKQILFIGDEKELRSLRKVTFDEMIEINSQEDLEWRYLERQLINQASEEGLLLEAHDTQTVPENIQHQLQDIINPLLFILEKMGIPFKKAQKKNGKPAKARHKWTKEVSEKEFFIDTRDSIATVMWIKRNQMLIKKGATIMKEAPLNKDGSVGFAAKMGDKIRLDHQNQFENFVTTEDIILKSVNEVGLFLYFAGTNSWLEMIDSDGKTLNEWTVVE